MTLKVEIEACSSRVICQKFWDKAELGNRLNLPNNARPVRRKQLPAALHDYVIEGNVEEVAGVGFDGHFCDVCEIINKVNLKLKNGFGEKNIVMMRGITSLCPSSTSFLDENSLILFANLFNSDSSVLKCEVATFEHSLERKADSKRDNSRLELLAYL